MSLDLDWITLDLEIEPSPGQLNIKQRPVPPPDSGSVWTLRTVDMFGDVIEVIPNVSITSITERLNTYGVVSFTVPKYSPGLDSLLLMTEAQVLRDGNLLFWGVIVAGSTDTGSGTVTFTMYGLEYYFERLYFGTAERTNMLQNGSFEDGMDGWSTYGCSAASIVRPDALRGERYAVLYDKTLDDAFVSQFIPYYTEWPFGQRITVSGWVFIDPEGEFVPGLENRGLYAVRWTDKGVEVETGETVDEFTPHGKWVRLQTSFTVAPFEQGVIEVRGYYIQPGAKWDEFRVSLMESTSGDPNGNDQSELIRRIINYAQKGRGKADLNIGVDAAPTGRVVPLRAWQHADHQPILEAVREFVEASDGVDFGVVVTPSSRTFTVFYPERGYKRMLTLDDNNCAGFSYSAEVNRSANSVVVLGPADGPTREEGGAWDYEAFGGPVLEDVVAAPQDASINSLDRVAEAEVGARAKPVVPLSVTVLEHAVLTMPEVGDRLNVDLDDGWFRVGGQWRVVERTFRPGFDVVDLVLVELFVEEVGSSS